MKKISIIIPVYNNFELTLQCIDSIKRNCKDKNYEIVVSDDCSNDETKEFFSTENEIKYVRNKENKGFAYTCNRGAEVADGDILLFLNNDTLLFKDILKSINGTFEKFNNVGIVGGKLLYSDNAIQHAGVIIYPDKRVGHLFRYFPADYKDANKVRELHAVTGACLAIEKNLFFKVGKFDENFINGFEDLDLCFKIKEMGLKVLYNPEISLYHLEEKTRANIKNKNDEINNRLISERWLNRVSPDFFLLNEGYDFKLNDICEFYLIKKNFELADSNDLFDTIKKEPLYFYGYKKLINHFINENNFDLAEYVASSLIKFEPVIDNYKILEFILKSKKDIERYKIVKKIINDFSEEKVTLKPRIEILYKELLEKGLNEIARYYLEWLRNF